MSDSREEARAGVALTLVAGIGPILAQRLIDRLGSARAVFSSSPETLAKIEGIGPKAMAGLREFREWGRVDGHLAALEKLGGSLICYGQSAFPKALSEIPAPPTALFVRGEILESDTGRAVAVVGTRKPDAYGRRVARDLASGLAAAGVSVVSGLARGIDQEAHQAALDAGGRTIAVLGCGLDVDYPRGSAKLREAIAQNGALVSEFPPGMSPLPENFRRRNRIISGVSSGVVVVQGSRQSGAVITVGFALEQGRQVFCVPGPIYSEGSAAPHWFLKQGAAPVESAADVLEIFGWESNSSDLAIPAPVEGRPDDGAKKTKAPASPAGGEAGLSESERMVIASLESHHPVHRDELLARVGLDAASGAPLLLSLELKGLIRAEAGGFYTRA